MCLPAQKITVPKPATNYLKVYREESFEATRPKIENIDSLSAVMRAFRHATGWTMHYQSDQQTNHSLETAWSTQVRSDEEPSEGRLILQPGKKPRAESAVQIQEESAQELATALGGMLGELAHTRKALWKREAELAAGVPLVPHPCEQQHLATRLQSVLQAGAQAVKCQAAGLYLLNETTTKLKLRSCWGLPQNRLAQPPRPLQGALADLEAMLGHAVVLEDSGLLAHWNLPEDVPAAVCVPVSTPTSILGTLWIYSFEKRDFNEHETNIIEVVAGRLAAELEREMLMREGVDGALLKHQIETAERTQRNQMPTIAPFLSGWDVAGRSEQAESVGGDFFDWFTLPDGLVATAVGDVMNRGVEASLSASLVKAALRSHGQYQREADALLRQVNLTLWTGSAGDQYATAYCGLLETASGRVRYCRAGHASVMIIRPGGWESLTLATPRLGESPEIQFEEETCQLQPGEALVILTDAYRNAIDSTGRTLGESQLAEALIEHIELPAKDMVTTVCDCLRAHVGTDELDDRTVLIVKRTTP